MTTDPGYIPGSRTDLPDGCTARDIDNAFGGEEYEYDYNYEDPRKHDD